MSAISRTGNSAIGRRAFTLIEMLIAMALTLILVVAIAQFYAYVGNTVKDGRAMIEMNNLMRVATTRLKADLELLTVPVVPWADDGSAPGYFGIGEGLACDSDVNGNNILDVNEAVFAAGNVSTLMGDSDDILAFTIRSPLEPFTGQHLGATVSSHLAEVIWFTGFTDRNGNGVWNIDEPMFLYRRQLLIVPDIAQIGPDFTGDASGFAQAQQFLANYWQTSSLSASIRGELDSSGTAVFRIRRNSLADLCRREHRFAHLNLPSNFPNDMQLNPKTTAGLSSFTLGGASAGEDRVLSNVLSFDVRVFDPMAQLRGDGELTDTDSNAANDAQGTLQPGDPGFLEAVQAPSAFPIVGFGAYVDLGYGHQLHGQLVGLGLTAADATTALNNSLGNPTASQFAYQSAYLAQLGRCYDTWALSYERDGYNQDGDGLIDEGTDGLDNDAASGVDDPGERETSPPYPVPLRGIQVRIRVLEPSSRQMRQATVGADFIQE